VNQLTQLTHIHPADAILLVPPIVAKPKDMIVGGQMCRFLSDEALDRYCAENEFSDQTIDPDGKITAWCGHYERWIPIGWTR